MTKRFIRAVGGERGSVLITGLLLSIALLMILGAAVDIGHAFIVRRDLVSIADQAALEGSQQISIDQLHAGTIQLDPAQAQAAALQAVPSSPGLTASATATTDSVSVEVKERFPTILLRLVGMDSLTVGAQAQATPRKP